MLTCERSLLCFVDCPQNYGTGRTSSSNFPRLKLLWKQKHWRYHGNQLQRKSKKCCKEMWSVVRTTINRKQKNRVRCCGWLWCWWSWLLGWRLRYLHACPSCHLSPFLVSHPFIRSLDKWKEQVTRACVDYHYWTVYDDNGWLCPVMLLIGNGAQ